MSEVARNARQASRTLDEIVRPARKASTPASASLGPSASWPAAGCSCRPSHRHQAAGRAAHRKGDNQILAVVMHLFEKFDRKRR
jgi:PhoH-like ATPase